MKKGILTKHEKFYIQENPDGLTVHELAKELDRNPNIVGKYIKKNEPVVTEEVQATPEPPKEEAAMFKLMGRHKRNNQNVATVMTKAASELADSTRPERLKNKSKLDSVIHKPMG